MTTTETKPTARINPRIRERRIEVQREAGRRRLRVLLVVSSVLSAVGLAFLAVTSPVLDVDHIRIVGAQHVTLAQVRAASSVHVHDHLLFVDAARPPAGSNSCRGSSTRPCSATSRAR